MTKEVFLQQDDLVQEMVVAHQTYARFLKDHLRLRYPNPSRNVVMVVNRKSRRLIKHADEAVNQLKALVSNGSGNR